MMDKIRRLTAAASFAVFLICVYAFLLGTKLLENKFENNFIAWYFLAKGIFCAMSLYLLVLILECLRNRRG